MLKKILSILSATVISTSSASTVVACGPITFKKLQNRTIDTTKMKTYIKQPIQHWSSGVTMQQEDIKVLVNLEDTLLQMDRFGNVTSDLANKWEQKNGGKQWTLQIDENAKWFDYKGNYKGQIKASDIANTMKYVFNPSTTSETVGLWTMLIENGHIIQQEVQKAKESITGNDGGDNVKRNIAINNAIDSFIKYDGKINNINSNASQPSLIVNDEQNTITFNLSKPSPFFDTVLTYLAFAPMPEIAVNPLSTGNSFENYGGSGESYKGMYYSGAYLPNSKRINATTSITLIKNKNFAWADKTNIETLIFNIPKNQDPSNFRFQFETGDLSETIIDPVDQAGWNKYVGKDINNQKFEGVHNIYKPSISTKFISYNYAKVSDESSNPLEGENLKINEAVAQLSTRALLSYAMNRSDSVNYYSSMLDNGKKTSSLIRNIYTAKDLKTFSKPEKVDGDVPFKEVEDYTQMVQNQYYDQVVKDSDIKKEVDPIETVKVLEDGNDGLMGNDFIAYNALEDETLKKEFKETTEYNKKVQILMKQVQKDLKKFDVITNDNEKINLSFLTNGTEKNTFNPYLNKMFSKFNDIENNPLKIIPIDTQDASDFAQKQRKGQYSMQILGWAPDYVDPSNFLNTIIYKGDYDSYNGVSKIIDNNDDNGKYKLSSKNNIKAFDKLAKSIENYSNEVIEIQSKPADDVVNRLNALAKQEAIYTYKDQFIIPLYVQSLEKQQMLTYVNPFSRATVGVSMFKYWNNEMIKRLWTREEFINAERQFNLDKEKQLI